MVPSLERHGVGRARWVRAVVLVCSAVTMGAVWSTVARLGRADAQAELRFSNCTICHLQVEEQLGMSVHGRAGVVCESCHGESRGHLDDEHNVLKPDRLFTPETTAAVCAECHPGAADVEPPPACATCHGVHGIRTLDEARDICVELGVASPHRADGTPPAIVAVTPAATVVERYGLLSIDTAVDADFKNPYDPDDIRVDVVFAAPSATEIIMPCFHRSGRSPSSLWQCRLAPLEEGNYSCKATVTTPSGTGESDPMTVTVTHGARDGFLRVDPGSRFAFTFDSGKRFRGVGGNFGWGGGGDPGAYERTFALLSAQGCNFVRTWMCPWNLPLEWTEPGLGRYNEQTAERLDEIVRLAEEYGILVMLVLDYHGVLCESKDHWGANDEWRNNPYNAALGGPCAAPGDFLTNDAARSAYKKRLRYIVARWSYSPAIAAWEFWNEIENTGLPIDEIRAWHAGMAAYLHKIDPCDHLVTTSSGALGGIWRTPGLDISQSHIYGRVDRIPEVIERLDAGFGKPTIVGEFGYDWRAPGETGRPEAYAIDLHLGLWRGLFSPTPVLPLTWWWDHHEARGELAMLGPVARLSAEMLADGPIEAVPDAQLPTASPAGTVELLACRTRSSVYVWLRNAAYSSSAIGANGTPPPAGNVVLVLPGLPTGAHTVQWYDTRSGEYGPKTVVEARNGEPLTLPVPPIDRDAAVRVVRAGTGAD